MADLSPQDSLVSWIFNENVGYYNLSWQVGVKETMKELKRTVLITVLLLVRGVKQYTIYQFFNFSNYF